MAYEYDHDCPFEAFITNLGKYNEGELVGEWVKFPTTSEELQKVFERIGIGSKDDFGNPYEEWFISDYDCYVDGLYEKLGEYENLDELNYLASKLDELDDHDYNHFQAAMQISDYTGSIKDVINLIDNLDKYEIYPGVESNADLGHYYIEELGMMEVPDYLADYIDYEAYGRDVAINEMGQFTDYGYVRDTQESFTEYYDGDRENIPDEYRVMDFMVSGEKERKTMNYETFKQEFAEDIKEKLYERGYDDVRISFNNVEKTNQNYEAMSVVPEGSNVGVNFNIENAFANYEHTDDYAGVLASATMVIADGLDRAPAIDVSALMDYENMKEKLSVEVISAEANADLLANVPHDRMEDLAVVYRFVMESSEDGRASILVTNNLMDRMGVSHEQLRSDALENSPEIRPVVIMGMNEVMKEMMGPEVYEMFGIPDDAEETMYVATVPDKNSGAGVIAYQDFMDQAAERVGGDFFVLPSSINEILLVPDNGDMTADALRDMVKDVNAKEVSPEERLSDNVYHYDSKDHVFELAEKFEARLAPFDIKELRDLTAYDELELDTLGDEKTALFLIMSDTDGTFNFLISMIYTQMFNLLCEKADDVYGGRLPVHVRCLIDEAANIGQIPNLEKLVATIRSREISACLVLQAKSQLKAIYKDNADTIIGNMDSQIFLGGTEQTTLKDLNAILGKETIDMYNTGQSKGSQESYNMNYQKLGKDLMTMDELAVMDGSKCIVQVRGVRPFLSDKYDLTQHPNYKLTADYDKRNYFDVVKFLSHNLILKADDEYQVIDVTE